MSLTVSQKKRIERFVNRTKDALGMKDKWFVVEYNSNVKMHLGKPSAALAFENFGACVATITINEDFFAENWKDDMPFLKKTLIHEVCHIVLFQYENAAWSIIHHLCHERDTDLYQRQLEQHSEITVDRLAIALSKLIPFEV